MMTKTEQVEKASTATSDELRTWLASGLLQSEDGAFCAWRDAETDTLAFAYPEITGYALTWLAGRSDMTDEERTAGDRAAHWLLERFGAGDRSAHADYDGGSVYTFDLGMIAAGLISYGRVAGSADAEALGHRVASDLVSYLQDDGVLPAIAPDGPPTSRPPEWSTAGVPHEVKCVQALLLAGEESAARRLIDAGLRYQMDDGRFSTQPADDRVMLHPHLYAVEGLWMAGLALDDSEYLERARAAAAWVWQFQLPGGGLPRYASLVGDAIPEPPEQLDVTSQAIRAAVLLEVGDDGVHAAAERLQEAADRDATGTALLYQPGSSARHRNAWVSMFGAQALEVVGRGPEVMQWNHLV